MNTISATPKNTLTYPKPYRDFRVVALRPLPTEAAQKVPGKMEKMRPYVHPYIGSRGFPNPKAHLRFSPPPPTNPPS
jgi:hypothetical protein